MPRIDPVKLLSCLKVLLAPNGGIRSANEVKRIAELMLKYSKKLVSKCIYIQILKCTNTDLLEKFMGAGGWGLTHIWLSDGIRTMNWPLVQEILELLLLCPVDVQRLRSNTAPKLVKSLCKDGGNEGVRILATKLVEQWLKIVKGETMATTRNVQNASGAPALQNDMGDHQSGATQANAVNTVVIDNHATSHTLEAAKEQDPLAIPSHGADESMMRKMSSITSHSPNATGDAALIYKIVIKDGKQMLAKVDPPATNADATKEKSESDSKHDESKRDDSPQPDSPGAKDREKDEDSKDSKESDKEKRDKEKSRDKDHKSSSSSHRKSSSSSSSKLSSSKSSSGSSSSKSKHHSSSSSSHRSSKDGSSSSSSKSKDRDKDRDKDKDRSSDKDRDKDRKSSSKSSSSSSSSSSKSKDRDRDKEKEKHRSSKDKDRDHKEKDSERSKDEKHKDKYKSDSQSSDSSEKSSKKPKEDSGSSPSHKPQLTSIQIPSKKASMSIEVRRDVENRPKTVKTYNSQFRSHGLAEEAPPPPSRKGLKKPITQSTPGTTIMSNIQLKRPSPPPEPSSPPPTTAPSTPPAAEKESHVPPQEKKIKIDLTPPTERAEKPGGIKLIAPKPKPSFLVESDMFMDALSASAHLKKDVRKRKRRPSTSKDADKESSTPGSPPESPVAQKVAPLKFYQDTLEEKEDGNHTAEDKSVVELDDDKNEDEDDIPLKRVKEVIEEKRVEEERLRRENEVVDESELNAKKPPGPGCGPDGPPGVLMLHRRRGPKKKLKWRPPEELEEVRFFELDETERVNVTKTFTDMKQIERFSEREAFMMARKLNCEDIMAEQTPYMPLIEVDDVPPHPEGNQSKEKKIQSEREQTTLKALYFSRAMIPESPAEPDMEEYHITEPAVIPLDDITGNPDAVNDFTSIPWPDPKGSPPPSDFMNNSDNVFQQSSQFPPFMPFKPNWNVEHGNGPPNGMPPSLLGPMNNFNNMNMNNMNNLNNMHNMHNMNNMVPQNMPPSLLMPPNTPDDRGNMNLNMNMMGNNFGGPGPFGPGPGNNGPGFDNMIGGFGMNNVNMGMNPNNNSGNNNRGGGGNWRGGGGGNWRPQGGNVSRTWLQGNSSRVCKQFQRGYCRNGIKCSYLHITPNRL